MSFRITFVIGFLALCAARRVGAEIVAEAMLVFPAQTDSIEYDNLAYLRNLSNYATFGKRFSGTVVQQARLALAKLDIQEEQVNEIVIGATQAELYGLLGGSFSGLLAAKVARKKSVPHFLVNDGEIFCPGAAICLLFLEDSLAAFGTSEQMKTLLEARQGIVSRLSANRSLRALMDWTERRAPMRGAAIGSQLSALMANAFAATSAKDADWLRYAAGISAFGYSVNLDSKAHISATMECETSTAATALRQMLGALAIAAGLPFQNMQVSSTKSKVELKFDAPIQ